MELTFIEKWYKFWGFGYVVNHNKEAREIHKLSNKKSSCHLDWISNKEYVTKRKAMKLIKKDFYNGCYWCWKEEDKG